MCRAVTASGQVVSSSTMSVPVPNMLPALATCRKSSGPSMSAGSRKPLAPPPGWKQRRLPLPETAPLRSISSAAVVPIGASISPGAFTRPDTPKTLVPPSSVRESARNHCGPLPTIWVTQDTVSTLLTVVGRP